MTDNTSVLKEDVDYLITRFNQFKTDLDVLSGNQTDSISLILDEDNLNSESRLLIISEKIQNLLKFGYVDGVKRSEEFYSELIRFNNALQLQNIPYSNKELRKSLFLQKIQWHRRKITVYLYELKLISDSNKLKNKTNHITLPIPQNVLEIPIDDFNGIFSVFISHKFIPQDQLLALELRIELRKNDIEGYLAESKKEYELLIGNKIREAIDKSEYVVAIITKYSQTSASVNQELGYALGIKKPIVIMIEKDAQHGVLTYGLEPEEFTRENFANHCKTVTEYILNKGERNTANKTPQILRETIYPELYDKMMKIHENSDAFKILTVNPWKDISPSSKLKIEEDIKQLFEEFTSKLSDWHTTLSRVNQNYTVNKVKLGEIISPAFALVSLTKPDGHIILDSNSSMEPMNWIDAFKFIIFDKEIINEQILYEKLVTYARNTENGHLRWLQDWKRQKPALFGYIFATLPQLQEVLRIDFFNEDMQKEKESINILVEKITKILAKRIS